MKRWVKGCCQDQRYILRYWRSSRETPRIPVLLKQLTYSPIKGPEGNIEYLSYLLPLTSESQVSSFHMPVNLLEVVEHSHNELS